MSNELFAIKDVKVSRLNTLVKNIMRGTGEDNPSKAIRLINQTIGETSQLKASDELLNRIAEEAGFSIPGLKILLDSGSLKISRDRNLKWFKDNQGLINLEIVGLGLTGEECERRSEALEIEFWYSGYIFLSSLYTPCEKGKKYRLVVIKPDKNSYSIDDIEEMALEKNLLSRNEVPTEIWQQLCEQLTPNNLTQWGFDELVMPMPDKHHDDEYYLFLNDDSCSIYSGKDNQGWHNLDLYVGFVYMKADTDN
jgi:hypothetical protein